MPRYTNPEDFRLDRQVAALDRRISALESGAGLAFSSITKGSLTIGGDASFDVLSESNIELTDGGRVRVYDGSTDVFIADSSPQSLFINTALLSGQDILTGGKVYSARNNSLDETSSATYTDLDNAATLGAGPQVTPIEIVSGVAIVIVSAKINVSTQGTPPLAGGGATTVSVTGPTSKNPIDSEALIVERSSSDAQDTADSLSKVIVYTDLSPGLYGFKMLYRRISGTAPVEFEHRSIVVLAL